MHIIDNNSSNLLGDDLKASFGRGTRLRIAASCFSIYAFEALKFEIDKNRQSSVCFYFETKGLNDLRAFSHLCEH